MNMKLLSSGTTANDRTGTPANEAVPILNGNFAELDQRTRFGLYRSGSLGRLKIALAGDSMMGYGAAGAWSSFLQVAMMLHYNADVMVDTRPYFVNDGATYPRIAADKRGMNFGAAARDTNQMLQYQLPYILEAIDAGLMHPVLWASPLQNDLFNAVGSPDAAVQRMVDFVGPIVERGIHVRMMGMHPKNDVGEATENAFGRHYIEQRLRNIAARTPGWGYIPILDLLKSGDPAEEARSLVQWRGPTNQVGGYSYDGTHSWPLGARAIAKRVADSLRMLASEVVPPVFDARAFDQTRNGWGNIIGTQGRLVGTGGKITDLSKAVGASDRSVATNNLPAGVELLYDASKGFTITPSLTGDPSAPIELTYSGTPTADTDYAVRLTSTARISDAMWAESFGTARWIDAVNVAGLAIGEGRLGLTGDDIIINLPGLGSWGGPGHIVLSPLNERIVFHSKTPGVVRNADARTLRYDLKGGVVAGRPLSGKLRIGPQGVFKTDNIF
jgi:hypothetical protein